MRLDNELNNNKNTLKSNLQQLKIILFSPFCSEGYCRSVHCDITMEGVFRWCTHLSWVWLQVPQRAVNLCFSLCSWFTCESNITTLAGCSNLATRGGSKMFCSSNYIVVLWNKQVSSMTNTAASPATERPSTPPWEQRWCCSSTKTKSTTLQCTVILSSLTTGKKITPTAK